MADEPIDLLIRYHHEYLVPDVQRLLAEQMDLRIGPLRDEMLTGFDKLHQGIAVLRSEIRSKPLSIESSAG